MFQTILLCVAVSFDGLGAGISYGSRNISIPLIPRIIISLFSAVAMATAMLMGWFLSRYIAPELSAVFGGIILISMGSWVIWQGKRTESGHRDKPEISRRGKKLRISSLYRVFSIDPREADLDGSGSINPGEAFLLGLALAGDAFGAGIGVAMSGFNPWITSLTVGVSKFFLLSFGFWAGMVFQKSSMNVPAHFLAGGILILLGIFNIL